MPRVASGKTHRLRASLKGTRPSPHASSIMTTGGHLPRIGSVQLASPVLLAPIAGYCDLAFRLVARGVTGMQPPGFDPPAGVSPHQFGLGLACTDLLCPHAILRENEKSLWLAATSPDDQPLCMQLYGRHPDVMAEAAQWAEAHGATTIDINMGCPVDKVTKKNGGSKLLCEPDVALRVVRAVVAAVKVPVTVKIRLGWDEDTWVTRTLPPRLADCGIGAITVHGRTARQMFSGKVNHEGIAQVVEALAHHPHLTVFGNGDIQSPDDALTMIQRTGCHGVMIGRAALGQPWLLRDTACLLLTGRRHQPLGRADRARLVLKHLDLLNHYRGPRVALNTIRQRIARYSPHLQPWPNLRRTARELTNLSALREMLIAGIEELQADPDAQVRFGAAEPGREDLAATSR
ncbi:MAG: tRNA dihydrouridine synthase DusB [Phycisphaeraceae bacterium]|nr:tRNA dihydrouridine synthase DusB [Phycisphaeraceae bacterium]